MLAQIARCAVFVVWLSPHAERGGAGPDPAAAPRPAATGFATTRKAAAAAYRPAAGAAAGLAPSAPAFTSGSSAGCDNAYN